MRVLITGSSSGIGRECAVLFLEKGYEVLGIDIKEDTIKYMFQGNPDGAGLMWKPNDNSPVEIRKGFFKVEDLIKAYNEIPV